MFDWIKRSVKNAVIAGFNEAIAEVTGATRPLPQQTEVVLYLPAPADNSTDAEDAAVVSTKRTARKTN